MRRTSVASPIRFGLLAALGLAAGTAPPLHAEDAPPKLQQRSRGLMGYISMQVPAPPEGFGSGVSLYAGAWPLLEQPLHAFQIGLASIWILPDNREIEVPLLPTGTVARDNWPERGPSYRDVFETIEGGLGFWASTRFGSPTAKFRMNGTANGYNHEISSPGWGFGQTEALAADEMGIAQISPTLLVPPDGFTFRDGTCGELFGYAWMALPLTPAKDTTAGLPVSTGSQCWTMFLNAENFRGPVAFYTPVTWSRISRRHPPAVGRGLDARPGLVTGGAIEVNTVPLLAGSAPDGTAYTRIPRLQFPADEQGRTVLIQDLTHYSRDALYRAVERWLAGGAPASGTFDAKAAVVPPCKARPINLRQGPDKVPLGGVEKWVETAVFGTSTFGLQWNPSVLEPWTGTWQRGCFPDYFRREGDQLAAVPVEEVPAATGLPAARFQPATKGHAYTSPDDEKTVWNQPGPVAGPFQARLADGSVLTYSWYRFIDQPALQDADLSAEEKQRLQAVVEQMHAHWTPEKSYLPPPSSGTLATLDEVLIVTPPPGLERGYVPIVTRQEDQ